MIELAVTIGLVISLIFIEAFGLAAGGIIVPGYIALIIGEPDHLFSMVLISFITFLCIKTIGKYTFLFGRRQMVVSLLIGTILAMLSHQVIVYNTPHFSIELSAVGWVIPGLIAHWSVKQGFVKTLSMLATISVIVRFMVIIAFNGRELPSIL